ncbi:hypothetical protein, partial [Stakelama sediminis]|uniref:hypothetical protein n=1 Tax=Stakelama sediminis TaxID=463200 RepID=UPI0031EE9A6B
FSCSSTIRTARARTSGENLFVVLLVIAPYSQELGPPTNPARFTGFITAVMTGQRVSKVKLSTQPFGD